MSRPSARSVIKEIATGFVDLDVPRSDEPDDGPIDWPGYRLAREAAAERSGEDESVLCGTAKIGDVEAVVIAFEFGFLGGSIGQRTGDRVEAAFARAVESRLPVVSLIATGGSRTQQGMRALSQLQRIARAAAGARTVPRISVLRDPTTGGGWATLGASADVILALPEAQVGFAGSRVRPADAPAEAYTAEAKLAWGQVDRVVPPADLPDVLERWLRLLSSPTTEAAVRSTSTRTSIGVKMSRATGAAESTPVSYAASAGEVAGRSRTRRSAGRRRCPRGSGRRHGW